MPEQLCLMQVHAHPDDEASKGAGTTAKYAAEGVHNVLVCCTGGEAGDILNPAVEHPGSPEKMHEMRMAELAESVRVLGYDVVAHARLPRQRHARHRDQRAARQLRERAAGRSGRPAGGIIRAERPQVIITYRDDRNFYPHPDHIRVHEISVPAFDLAGDPEAYPDAGEPWQPLKMYYVSWSIARVKALHEAYEQRGEESPYTSWFERGFDENRKDEFTTLIDVGDFLHKRREALLAHRTQVDPTGFWMRLPDDVIRVVFPWEEFTLARSLVDNGVAGGEFEDDLFAGVRERVAAIAVIVEFVVAAGKKEQARSWACVLEGVVSEQGIGPPADPADVTFTATPADAQALHDGSLDLSVGFMRGQVKMAGDFGALLRFLPLTHGASPNLRVADMLPG